MKKEAYDQLYQAEDTCWYHNGLRKLVEISLRRIEKESCRRLKILDIGSGTGGMFNLLKKYGKITGLELSEYAIELNRRKHPDVTLKTGSANNLSELFPKPSFDLITFFNVLYHRWIEDDNEVLKQAASIVKPGGYIILVDAAFKCLYRYNDEFCYGGRRYSSREMCNKLSKAGFSVVKSTYFNSISFFPLLTLTLLQRFGVFKSDDRLDKLNELPFSFNETLKGIMSFERMVINILGGIPLGVSLLSVAQLPNK